MLKVDLAGKRALVTGGNSGIGAAIATTLAECGADVAINYVAHAEIADAMASGMRTQGRRAMAIESDVSDPKQVEAMFQKLDAEWGGVDILVNNAGVDGPPQLAVDADLAEWRRVLDINLFGAFACAQQALRRMVPRGSGVIVNMSSVHETIPWSRYSAYASAKAGIAMLTRTLAQEVAPHGIRVVAVAPGAIRTAINHAVWSDPVGLADLNTKIPMNRMGEPDEIARMVAVLASDLGSYVTGTSLFVDGGMVDFPAFAHGG